MSSTAPSLWLPSPKIPEERGEFGVYIHFPWCLAKCPYCDFLSLPIGTHVDPRLGAKDAREALPHVEYTEAVLAELAARGADLAPGKLQSIFIGGGTPSLWHPDSLGRVTSRILEMFDTEASSIEITAEANPSSLDEAELEAMAKAGINRVSIGVQSLDLDRLRFLGRLHDGEQAKLAVRRAIASPILRVSADMIYGVRGQAPEDAVQEITEVAALGLRHISAYTLTIEPNTRFGELERRGKLPLLDEGRVAESYQAVSTALEARGFTHYEISNFSMPGEESIHNLGYWRGRDYLGVGVGAVGTVTESRGRRERVRYKNIPHVDKYMRAFRGHGPEALSTITAETETIDGKTAIVESLMLGLRTVDGVNLAFEADRRGVDAWTEERTRAVERLTSRGLLSLDGSILRIPKRHWILADQVIRELI
jgi:putative oxygen-independent coproporphyrinogen III oxidase